MCLPDMRTRFSSGHGGHGSLEIPIPGDNPESKIQNPKSFVRFRVRAGIFPRDALDR